jgi:hypothetical protein
MKSYSLGTLLCAAVVAAGCAAGPSYQPQRQTYPVQTTQPPQAGQRPQTAEGTDTYIEHLFSDPRLDPIRNKVPLLLRAGVVTPSLVSNDDRPTKEEKRAIKLWESIRERAQQYQLEQRGPPSPLLVHTRQLVTTAIVQLYEGELTYGQFAGRIQQLDTEYQAAARRLR